MVNTLEYKGNKRTTDDTDRGHSNALWDNCPILAIRENNSIGMHRRVQFGVDGFKLSTNVNAAQAYWSNGFNVFGDNGFAISQNAELGGGITMGSDGDNEGGSLQLTNAALQIAQTTKMLWWEARLKTSTVADTKHGFVVGLWEPVTQSATVPIAAAGTLADQNFVGFHRLEGDGVHLDTVYKANGVTQVTVKADAATIAADTYFKIGMLYDPGIAYDIQDPNRTGQSRYNLKFFFNGRQLADYKAIPSAAGTDFPNDVQLAPIFAMLNATATTPGTCTLDWMEWAQLFTNEIPN